LQNPQSGPALGLVPRDQRHVGRLPGHLEGQSSDCLAQLPGTRGWVFVFFSNNLGCLGSILVSLIGTLLILLLVGVINLN
jgi:hypothetical protein